LLAELRRCTDDGAREHLRHLLVVANIPWGTGIAMRYRSRGASLDDLIQAAHLGLVKAVNGFDPARGNDFIAYAAPTVAGEVKRYFRDQGWDIRPPRRVQELRLKVQHASAELAQILSRSPRVGELAEYVGVGEEQVIECLASADNYHLNSLDAPTGGDEDVTVADALGEPDPGLDKVEDLMTLKVLIGELPERDRRILSLRFFHDCSQREIAAHIGVTQMQVSRLLAKVLARLRAGMTAA
jgi:RNA polymerase sigma-B factor